MKSASWSSNGRTVMRLSLEGEVCGSNLGPAKSGTVLPTARHRRNVSSQGTVLPERNDAEMAAANLLQQSRNTASIIKDLILKFSHKLIFVLQSKPS